VFQTLVDIEGAEEGFEQIGAVLGLQLGFRTGVEGVVGHTKIITDDRLRPVVHQ